VDDAEARIRASWVANAEGWTTAVRGRAIPSRQAGTDAAIVTALSALPPGRLLDVGCGEGWLARALASTGHSVVGIDASPPLVERARELGGGDFRVLGYEALAADPAAVAGAPFDAVVCNFSLLGEELVPLLRALAQLLAPDAPLLIQTVHPFSAVGETPYRDGWREETFAGFGSGFQAPMPWYFRTVGSWLRVLAEAGFMVTSLDEPLNPSTGRPLSLLIGCATVEQGTL
jgi:2-polyprenyl-3-methyl-5-hydroxy-6-metoxy-1,4-benzoquinol methylase